MTSTLEAQDHALSGNRFNLRGQPDCLPKPVADRPVTGPRQSAANPQAQTHTIMQVVLLQEETRNLARKVNPYRKYLTVNLSLSSTTDLLSGLLL